MRTRMKNDREYFFLENSTMSEEQTGTTKTFNCIEHRTDNSTQTLNKTKQLITLIFQTEADNRFFSIVIRIAY